MLRLLVTGLLIGCLALARIALADTDPMPDPNYPPTSVELTLESQGARLPGLIYLANGPGPHPTVVLLHGFPGNERNLDVAQALRRSGFNALFFSYRGAWGSEGDYALDHLVDDALAALTFLRNPKNTADLRVDTSSLSFLGHSFGGWTALAAATRDDALACVAALAPAELASYADNVKAGNDSASAFADYAAKQFMLRGFSADAMRDFLLNTPRAELDLSAFGSRLVGKQVLLIAGDQDTVVPPEQMFDPVVAAYRATPGLDLEAHTISGDHSFNESRLTLTDLVRNWMVTHCRSKSADAQT
ncbi:MAG: alpha/beta fold hydrolase [Pseudomonadota bacterium]